MWIGVAVTALWTSGAFAVFTRDRVLREIGRTVLDPGSLGPYLFFRRSHYTRNLIYRDDTFELLALCWDPHTESPIHNHSGQLCWLSVQRGALRLDNYLSLDGPGPGNGIRLVPNGGIERAGLGVLDLQQGDNGIHRVSNPFDERAVSLHVYSRPFDICLAYDPAARTSREMRLHYHSVGGKLVDRLTEQRQ